MQVRSNYRKTGAGQVAAVLAMLMVLSGTQRATAQESPVIHQFIGAWQGQGTLFGAAASFEMNWEWVLAEKFVRLSFGNSVQGPEGGQAVLRAQAFYRPVVDELWEGTWFDSRGMVLPLRATVSASELVTHWGSPESEQGRTVYRLLGDGGIEVEDWVNTGGQWRQFGQARYRRSKADQD